MKTESIKSECRKDKPFFRILFTLSLCWGFESLQYPKKEEELCKFNIYFFSSQTISEKIKIFFFIDDGEAKDLIYLS